MRKIIIFRAFTLVLALGFAFGVYNLMKVLLINDGDSFIIIGALFGWTWFLIKGMMMIIDLEEIIT